MIYPILDILDGNAIKNNKCRLKQILKFMIKINRKECIHVMIHLLILIS
jgi:hypothetical protein